MADEYHAIVGVEGEEGICTAKRKKGKTQPARKTKFSENKKKLHEK
jgi:hypothetical protein